MKIYIVLKMTHCDDYKRGGAETEVMKVFRDKEAAYKLAHEIQVEGLLDLEFITLEDFEENEGRMLVYARDPEDSWEVSHAKAIGLLDEFLPEPKYTDSATQYRCTVEEKTVE